MKQWFQKFAYKMAIWMQGRYGYDEFSKFLTIGGLIVLILSRILNFYPLYLLSLAAIIWANIRIYSKKIAKRQKERAWYLNKKAALSKTFNIEKRKWQDRKTYRYFKCAHCGTTMRVPKGKGKIKITCPNCGQECFKKS